ncbi:MaoC family dehydratase [Amycolatopsis sp. NPDC024027]|uniref:MaoC family dehydratase n=1 Tax=Amycolatopsis sp. NPDC024027 TaxID=3154327 RepID=UPI0033CE65E4
MTAFESVQALAAATGRVLGTSDWQVITRDRILAFAEVTGDRQWIHVDDRRAREEGPFGDVVAHGALTLSLVPVFVQDQLRVRGISMMINAGLEKVRFRTPVPAGARVRGRVQLADVVAMDGATRVLARTTVLVEGSPKPACVADQVVVLHA